MDRMLYTDPIYPPDEFHPEERDPSYDGLLPGDTVMVTNGRDRAVVLTLGRWQGKPAVEVEFENGQTAWLLVDDVKLVDE